MTDQTQMTTVKFLFPWTILSSLLVSFLSQFLSATEPSFSSPESINAGVPPHAIWAVLKKAIY